MSTEPPELMTVRDVAVWLRTTAKAVRNMNDRGQLPRPLRIGRRILWRRLDLDRWIERKAAESLKGIQR